MFKVDDKVSYGLQGACRIKDIVTRMTEGGDVEFYLLSPIFSETVSIYVPVENRELTARMRPLIKEDAARELLSSLDELTFPWIADAAARKEHFRGILSKGDCRGLLALIHTIYRHRREQRSKGKRLQMNDERALSAAEKILFSELAAVLGEEPTSFSALIAENMPE